MPITDLMLLSTRKVLQYFSDLNDYLRLLLRRQEEVPPPENYSPFPLGPMV